MRACVQRAVAMDAVDRRRGVGEDVGRGLLDDLHRSQ
jgi:hypothetical protein